MTRVVPVSKQRDIRGVFEQTLGSGQQPACFERITGLTGGEAKAPNFHEILK
jgi:hypothetical protein